MTAVVDWQDHCLQVFGTEAEGAGFKAGIHYCSQDRLFLLIVAGQQGPASDWQPYSPYSFLSRAAASAAAEQLQAATAGSSPDLPNSSPWQGREAVPALPV